MPVKVAHIVTRLDFGGAQQNTLHTVEHLDRERFEPLLVCGRGGYLDDRTRALGPSGSPVRTRFIEDLDRSVSPLRDLMAFLQLYAVLSEEKPEIVHTHSSKAGILGRLAAALAGVPVIVHTFHGFGFHEGMPKPVRAAYVLLERISALFSSRLVFVSKANMGYARSYRIGAPEAYRLIRSGVRLSDFPAAIESRRKKRESLGVPADAPLVVCVGNLKPQKNARDFVRAARAVCGKMPEARFVFVGEGPLRGELEDEVRGAGLKDRILFPGWRKDTGELLAAADVFFLTSLWEGLPRALVEAMKSGLPCVAYSVDGVSDILRDGVNGFAVEPRDWAQAGRRVAELLKDRRLRARLGAQAAASIGDEFDIDGMVRSQEKLYSELV